MDTVLLAELDDDFLLLSGNNVCEGGIFNKDFDIDNFSNSECLSNFRFEKHDIRELKHELQIPNKFVCRNGTALSGTEALCIMLRRFAYPNRLTDLTELFSRPKSEISLVVNAMTSFLYDNFNYLLTDLDRNWLSEDYLKTYAEVITNAGSPLDKCWGFIDGTVRPMCRPSTNQRIVFNGHKRVHSLKFQSVVIPNGLIANLYGPIEGRRHDSGLLRESGLLGQIRDKMTMDDGTVYYLYGDPAYPLCQHLVTPFKGPRVSNEEQLFNEKMSAVRVSVELCFNKVVR